MISWFQRCCFQIQLVPLHPGGTSAELRIRTVSSLRDLRGYDAVVVAAGAAVASLAELSRADALPLQLQGGHVIELVPPTTTAAAAGAEGAAEATALSPWWGCTS